MRKDEKKMVLVQLVRRLIDLIADDSEIRMRVREREIEGRGKPFERNNNAHVKTKQTTKTPVDNFPPQRPTKNWKKVEEDDACG